MPRGRSLPAIQDSCCPSTLENGETCLAIAALYIVTVIITV
jgi:hypothetical protein